MAPTVRYQRKPIPNFPPLRRGDIFVPRGVSGNSKPTLGKLMQRHPDLFPKPVDNAVEKLWGYASENARHGREGNAPTREEAMLIVGISVTLVNYLIHKSSE